MNKDKIKEILKSNKGAALAIAVALVVSNPIGITGCAKKQPPNQEEKEEENQGSSGGSGDRSSGFHWYRGSSSSSSKSKGTGWSSPSSGKSYSGTHGGSLGG